MLKAVLVTTALMLTASPAFAQIQIPKVSLPGAPAPPTGPPPGEGANPDPWEGTNRQFYAIHQSLDKHLLRPAAMGYKAVTPGPIGVGLHNFFVNLGEPVTFLDDITQVRITQAADTAVRFLLNSSVGIGGLVDVAGIAGDPHHDNNFGVTLGVWGVRPGPYVFIPLLGPSTARDLVGKGVDMAANPFNWVKFHNRTTVTIAIDVVGGLDTRASVDGELMQLDKMSTDSYATLRSVYLQNQQSMIQGGQLNVQNLPDFDDPGVAGAAGAGAKTAPAGAAPAAEAPPAAAPPKGGAADSDKPTPPADAPRP